MIGFAEFLGIVYGDGRSAHPWQVRLAQRCVSDAPPDVISLPTGAGKTTTVDALVWALAHQADLPAARRTVGVRIVWAIDRRIVVDEVYDHACRLAALLEHACGQTSDPLHEIARRLAEISGDRPLVATRWRGGLGERPERHGPLQPQIITSTVAQIGSRLLFRGFGVGERSLALEAGLAGCDTTICVDEAHLAQPFKETVDAIRGLRLESERACALPRLGLITITATPHDDSGEAMVLQEDDRASLGARWNAPKEAMLEEPAGARDADCVKALVAATLTHVEAGAPTVACVVNTVRRARDVFGELRAKLADTADVGLLIGPQRPADRARFLDAGRRAVLFDGQPPAKPIVVVATQTLEVGLDVDVAAMVTESASAAALVQRFGRLNRRGVVRGRATVVRDADGWLYRDEEAGAWDWLRSREREDGTVDVSVAALHDDPSRPPPRDPQMAPMLTSGVVEHFVQTTPCPHVWAEPDVEVFLRGVDSEPRADVALCWRCDLRLDVRGFDGDGYRKMLLELVPPHTQELLTLSVSSARALLAARFTPSTAAARAALGDADVEGETADMHVAEADAGGSATGFMVLRRGELLRGGLDGLDGLEVSPRAIQPGDTVVLATDAGGADEYGLAPRAPRATDVAPDVVRVPDGGAGRTPAGDDVEVSGGSPPPVRITRLAVEASINGQLDGGRWQRIERACRKAEAELRRNRAPAERAGIVSRLLAELTGPGLLPGHEGLLRLARRKPDTRLALRIVGPVDEDGMPILDETELADDDDDSDEQDAAEVEATEMEELHSSDDGHIGPGVEEKAVRERSLRAWVLVAFPPARRDWDERLYEDRDNHPPRLEAHERAVSDEVSLYAHALELAPRVADSLGLAARAHDHGKADRRIQAYFRGGVAALDGSPLAKSVFGTRDPRADRQARALSGLPSALRHEIGSAAVLASALADGAIDPEGFDAQLALHLVGVHHGLGRPIPPVPRGGAPSQRFRAESAGVAGDAFGDGRDGWDEGAWLERFWRMVERYGPWGIAYLEGLLVAADRVVSARGQ